MVATIAKVMAVAATMRIMSQKEATGHGMNFRVQFTHFRCHTRVGMYRAFVDGGRLLVFIIRALAMIIACAT